MAHINHREVREQRGRRRTALLCILLFIPLVLAGWALFSTYNAKLNADTVTEIRLSYNGNAYKLTEKADIAPCMNAIDGAAKITQSTRPLSEYKAVAMICTDSFTEAAYTFYLSENTGDCLITDSEGALFSIFPDRAEALLLSDAFSFLYRTSPVSLDLTVGSAAHAIRPTYSWNYVLPNGEERTTSGTAAEQTVKASQMPGFILSDDPDELSLTVNIAGEEKTGTLAQISEFLPAKACTATVTVKAVWNNPDADLYYGTAEYRFTLEYAPEA